MRIVVLVDGEHYPPVTRWAIETARERGHEVVAALFVGGVEKLAPGRAARARRARRWWPGADRMAALARDRRARARRACSTCPTSRCSGTGSGWSWPRWRWRGVPYVGADFRLDPPSQGPPLPVPTLAVIGTGKRTGKTAIGGEVARLAARRGLDP